MPLVLSGSQDSDQYTHPVAVPWLNYYPMGRLEKTPIFTGKVLHSNSHPSHSASAFPPTLLLLSLGQSVPCIPFFEHPNCLAFFCNLEVPQRLSSIDMTSVDMVLVLEVTCNSCIWTRVSANTDSIRRSNTVSRNWASSQTDLHLKPDLSFTICEILAVTEDLRKEIQFPYPKKDQSILTPLGHS